MSKTSRQKLATQRLVRAAAATVGDPTESLIRNQYLPRVDEHVAWMHGDTPEDFIHDTFTSEDVEAGIRCVSGQLKKDGSVAICNFCFDHSKMTAAAAQDWLQNRGTPPKKFDPAHDETFPQITAKSPRHCVFNGDKPVVIRAEAKRLPTMQIHAYSGGMMNITGFRVPLVVDIGGMSFDEEQTPVLFDHESGELVGHGSVKKGIGGVELTGIVSGTGDRAKEVVSAAQNGVKWRASIGVELPNGEDDVRIGPGAILNANGRRFDGPLIYWPKSVLSHIAIVGDGADKTSSVSIAARNRQARASFSTRRNGMDEKFVAYLEANGFKPDEVSEQQTRVLQASYQRKTQLENKQADIDKAVKDVESRVANAAAVTMQRIDVAHAQSRQLDAVWNREEEDHRVIRAKGAVLRQKAIEEQWTPDKIELEFLRLGRPVSRIGSGESEAVSSKILEAAFAKSTGLLRDMEKKYDAQTLEAADAKQYRGLGLKGLLVRSAQARGYQGRWIENDRDIEEVFDFAFRSSPRSANAATGSTVSLPGILSNLQNKFLYQGFWGIESSWRDVAYVRSVNDFKPHPAFRFFGNMTFEKLGANGELKHGNLGETAYVNRVDTYGKFLVTTRQNIRDDDMSALSYIPQAMGMGAAYSLNNIFWAMVLSGTDFFGNAMFYASAGKDGKGQSINPNSFTGASLSGTSPFTALSQARQAFRQQIKPDGNPIGMSPVIMLVPPALETIANAIYTGSELRQVVAALGSTGSTKTDNSIAQYVTQNQFQGAFRVVQSAYLSSVNAPQGSTGSDTSWYLLGDPGQVPVYELAFLDGNQAPTVQSSEADFDTLGIAHRGFHDFGAAALEPRGIVKNAA